jgi:hypothetical protein
MVQYMVLLRRDEQREELGARVPQRNGGSSDGAIFRIPGAARGHLIGAGSDGGDGKPTAVVDVLNPHTGDAMDGDHEHGLWRGCWRRAALPGRRLPISPRRRCMQCGAGACDGPNRRLNLPG